MVFDDDLRYKIFTLLSSDPRMSQRALADALGVSLGKVNYCLKALMEMGWVKAKQFRNSERKLAYAYLLTPHGIEEKARVTMRFLKRKIEEYEALELEIERLRKEVQQSHRRELT